MYNIGLFVSRTLLPRKVLNQSIKFMTLLYFLCSSVVSFALEINQTYEKALQAFHQEKYQDSIIYLKNILAEDTNHLASRVLMAENLLITGKPGAAEVELNSALKSGADKFRITPLLARSFLLQTNYQRILDIYIPETSTVTYQSIMQTYVGYAYLGQKHYLSASQAFEQALTFNPTNIEALIGLAKISILKEERDQALPLLEQALSLDNEHKQALLMLSIVYKLKNQSNAALATVNTLLGLEEKNYSALLTRAMLLSSLGQHEQAIADLDVILLHYPNEPIANYIRLISNQKPQSHEESKQLELHLMAILAAIPAEAKTEQPVFLFLTGLVNYQNNAMENAQKSLLKYHKIAPEDLDALILLAKTEMALADFYSAKKYLVKAHLLAEDNVEVWSLLGRNYLTLNELDKAEFYFNKALNNQPNDLTSIIDLATLYQINENYDGVKSLLTPAAQIETEKKAQKTQILVMLLKALQELQQLDIAMTYSQQLLKHDAHNSYAHQIQGTLLALKGYIPQAKQYFIRAIELDENNFQAVMYLARVDAVLGNVSSSIRLLKLTLDKGANSALYIELGDVYYGIGDMASSLVWYQKALAFNPSSILALKKVTSVHLKNDQLNQAITTTESYITNYSENAQAYQLLAKLYKQQGNYKNAITSMNQFVRLANDRANAFYQLAQLQISINKHQDAITSLQKAKAWQKDYMPAYLLLISLYTENKDQDKTLSLIDEFSAINQDSSLIARLKGDLYWSTAQLEQALTFYQQSYEETKNREALLGIFKIFRSKQQYPRITPLLISWLALHPNDLTLAISLAENYRQMGLQKQAITYYLELLETHPENAVLLNNAAIVHRELSQYELAITLSERAHKLMPNNVIILDTKAWIKYHRTNYTDALALLRQANTLEFENAEIKYHLAATLAKLNRVKEAKKYLKESVLSPQDYPEKEQAKALLATW